MVSAEELSQEIRRVVKDSLDRNNDAFFISDIGGGVTANWIKSAFVVEPLGPQVLQLKMPVYLYHGTGDQSTSVEPVYQLQKQITDRGLLNFHFQFYPGLDHELTRQIVTGTMFDMADRLVK